MKTYIALLTLAVWLAVHPSGYAMQSHDKTGSSAQSHGNMADMGFKHDATVDGVRSEFQVMRLSSMNMKDDQGKTHHIMVRLFDEKSQAEIKNAVGKIKIIAPDGAEQISALKDYGGVFASNFTFSESGKYGVICLLKVDDQKKVFKFWYDHHAEKTHK